MGLRDKRFNEKLSGVFEKLNSSLPFDSKLYRYDILGSIAYARALHKASVIDASEMDRIIQGLIEIKSEIDEGVFEFRDEDEDIHMSIERRLVEKIGAVANKLHTGRSRNEQIVLDERLYLKDFFSGFRKDFRVLLKALVNSAERNSDAIIPGFTHTRLARPISAGFLFMGYYTSLKRNLERILDYEKRLDTMVLGSGAIGGATVGVDREFLKNELGMNSISENALDGVASRDFLSEAIFISALIFIDYSRVAEDLILFSSEGYGFVELPEALCTTSSLMPQKKNPDALELIRGKSSHAIATLTQLLTMQKALPFSYNRDLQEDKVLIFDALENLDICTRIMSELFNGIRINKDRALSAIRSSGDFIYATDMVDYLVKKGVSFREAHRIVGGLVNYAEKKGVALSSLSVEEFKKFSVMFDDDVFNLFDVKKSVDAHDCPGGTNIKRVKEAIQKALRYLDSF